MNRRQALLLAGVLASAGLLWLDGGDAGSDAALPVARPPRPGMAAAIQAAPARRDGPVAARADLAGPGVIPPLVVRGQPAAPGARAFGLFAAKSWAPPPPAAPASAPAAVPLVPQAPPLPFQYVGRQRAAGIEQVFLTEGDQLHAVQLHSVIRGLYRVEQLGATAIVLTYLPMHLRQQLSTGSSD